MNGVSALEVVFFKKNSHSKELKIQQYRGEVMFLTSTVFSKIIVSLKFDDSVNIRTGKYYMHLNSFGVI